MYADDFTAARENTLLLAKADLITKSKFYSDK